MTTISGVNNAPIQPLAASERAPGAAKAQPPQEETRSRPLEPARDEYVPREKRELCAVDTGKVDREIQRLKMKRQELEQRLSTEPDGARSRELERQLAQVERALGEKDNDAYRKRHSTFTRLS